MNRRWNSPLVLGLLLSAALIGLLVLPWLVELRGVHLGRNVVYDAPLVRIVPLKPGQASYILGTDKAGRDLFSRVVYGARITLGIAATAVVLRFLLAIPLGIWVGWRGGWTGRLVGSMFAGLSGIPALIWMLVILIGLRYVIKNPMTWLYFYTGVMVVLGVPRLGEQVRQLTVQGKVAPFMEAAVAVGAPPSRILRRHLLPGMVGDLLIMAAVEMASVLLLMGQLAMFGVFMGAVVEVRDGSRLIGEFEYLPEWGQMVGANVKWVRGQPWIPLSPGIALCLSIACFHLLGEGLRQRRVRQA